MTATTSTLIAPTYRSDPNAAEFAAVLELHLPGWAAEMRDYAWDAPIPPQSEWEREAAELAAHLQSL